MSRLIVFVSLYFGLATDSIALLSSADTIAPFADVVVFGDVVVSNWLFRGFLLIWPSILITGSLIFRIFHFMIVGLLLVLMVSLIPILLNLSAPFVQMLITFFSAFLMVSCMLSAVMIYSARQSHVEVTAIQHGIGSIRPSGAHLEISKGKTNGSGPPTETTLSDTKRKIIID